MNLRSHVAVPVLPLLLAALAVPPLVLAQEPAAPASARPAGPGLIPVAGRGQPFLAYGIERRGQGLVVTVEVAGAGSAVQVGVAGTAPVILASEQATVERGPQLTRFTWSVPLATLKPDAESHLHLGIAVRWSGGPNGSEWRRERYLHTDGREPSAVLSSRPQDWTTLDLHELEQRRTDLTNRLVIDLKQPMDGRYSVVIEDLSGARVRNLVSGQPAKAGAFQVEWDGATEDGALVAAGSYRWRAVHHPGITPQFVTSWCNAGEPGFKDLLSNHNHLTAAGADGEHTFLAAPMTEGGFAISAFGRDGRWQRGFNPILGMGMNAIQVASDGKRLYIVNDGEGWGMKLDRSKPDWTYSVATTLARFDLATGEVVDYKTKQRWSELETHAMGPGSAEPGLRATMSLTGVAFYEGRLYVGSRAAQALLVVDPDSGAVTGRIALPEPGPLATAGGRLVVFSQGRPQLVDAANQKLAPLWNAQVEKSSGISALDVRACAMDADGTLYLADRTSSTVVIIDRSGTPTRLSTPGDSYVGTWDEKRMVNPSGLALLDGKLWVAEDRTFPKRAVVWDLTKRPAASVVKKVFGNPNYNSPGSDIDPDDATHVLNESAHWKLDPKTGAATCTAILGWPHIQLHW
ncbi:MAG TPA: FlgD immunoglobulin-like domain containing protein, partial [Planctomycetota bacterium]|nr:FlgD immunoglobulin-like domain containing protein [Planctomycetota bacterium]